MFSRIRIRNFDRISADTDIRPITTRGAKNPYSHFFNRPTRRALIYYTKFVYLFTEDNVQTPGLAYTPRLRRCSGLSGWRSLHLYQDMHVSMDAKIVQ